MKSKRWLMMTDEERYRARQRAIAMLEQMYLDPLFNEAAKEATYLMGQRMQFQNERLAEKIAREAAQRARHQRE